MQKRMGWLLSVSSVLAMTLAWPAHAKPLYNCPNLHNDAMQQLAPMTQGAEGWFFRSSDLEENYELLPVTRRYLQRISQAFKDNGAQLIYVAIPPRSFAAEEFLDRSQPMQDTFDIENARKNYDRLLTQLRDTGAWVVSSLENSQEYDSDHDNYFFFKRDNHWTPYGAMISAGDIAGTLKESTVYTETPKTEYTTAIEGEFRIKNEMGQEIQRLCTDDIPPEVYPKYVTNAKVGEGEDALFGDGNGAPPLVLIGSSYSATQEFNFEGFLAEKTGLEVANYAISAGQLFNSIISYTALPKEERRDPNFVLWEQLAHYDFNDGERAFRQIIPAISGECSAEEAIATKTVNTKRNQSVPLFTLDSAKNITGSNYFFFVQSDDLGFVKYNLELEYADGDGEWFAIDRSANFNNSGRFFIELTDEIKVPLASVALKNLSETDAKVQVRLCKVKTTKKP